MVADLAGSHKRPVTGTIRQEQRAHEREWRLEPQRSRSSGAGYPALAQPGPPGDSEPGSRHDLTASKFVRSAQPCDGSTGTQLPFAEDRATNTSSQVSVPIAGQHLVQRQFVCGSLAQVYASCVTVNKIPISRTVCCDYRHRKGLQMSIGTQQNAAIPPPAFGDPS